MSEVMDYKSRLSDPASRKFETFSYLPAMDAASIKKQVEYLVKKGWNPAIEHIEPEHMMDSYWYGGDERSMRESRCIQSLLGTVLVSAYSCFPFLCLLLHNFPPFRGFTYFQRCRERYRRLRWLP